MLSLHNREIKRDGRKRGVRERREGREVVNVPLNFAQFVSVFLIKWILFVQVDISTQETSSCSVQSSHT